MLRNLLRWRADFVFRLLDGRVWMKPDGIATFAGDLPEQEQKVVWATHAAPAADLFTQKVEGTAWKSKPSWYIVANKDRTVQPELQRIVAHRIGDDREHALGRLAPLREQLQQRAERIHVARGVDDLVGRATPRVPP